jgi:adenosylcobinamide-GDP ribazoletransferase
VLVLAGGLLGVWGALMAAGALAAVFACSTLLARRLGGLTGDALGAGVELGELAFVLAGASFAHLGLI